MIEKIKVVSPQEIVRVEKIACTEGCSEEMFMEKAGTEIALLIEEWITKHKLPSTVIVIAGKGNNGGDGYVAARVLLQKGFSVQVIAAYAQEYWGKLCYEQAEKFLQCGGKILPFASTLPCPKEGILVDALVGTGFIGEAKEELKEAILWANQSHLPILAIDIPSGLCGTTGQVGSVAIYATATIYLEFPKIGFFLEKGWNHVGKLLKASFGLPSSYQEAVTAIAFLVEGKRVSSLLPSIERTRNKYTAGYALIFASSPLMRGAGSLSSYAALRSGSGIVRWFHLGLSCVSDHAPWEVIACSWEEESKLFFQEMKRATSILIGPGLGRTKEARSSIRKILSKCSIPSVIDADALFFLAKNPSFSIPAHSILTPHRGELERLLQAHALQGDFVSNCQTFAKKKQTTLLVKGAPNFLFSPQEIPLILPFGNPGMATAGSGDVLSGILVALLAQKMAPQEAAILGSFLHGLAGDLAAREKTPYSLVASDLIEYLPRAFTVQNPSELSNS